MTVNVKRVHRILFQILSRLKWSYSTIETKMVDKSQLMCSFNGLFFCLFVLFLGCQLQGSQLGWEQPRRLDLLLPLDLHSHVLYILVRPTAELARARVSRWYSIFILQSHSLKQKQLWTSNHTGPIKLFNNRLLLPIGMAWDLQRNKPCP